VDERGKTAKEKYDTRASELGFGVRDFALGNGIRNLPQKAAEQFCARQTFYKADKWCMEPKTGSKGRTDTAGRAAKGFKERMGFSPDHADSAQIFVEHCRQRGAEPAFAMTAPRTRREWEKVVQQGASDYDESNYTESEDYSAYSGGYTGVY
jgi:hypothetical protein